MVQKRTWHSSVRPYVAVGAVAVTSMMCVDLADAQNAQRALPRLIVRPHTPTTLPTVGPTTMPSGSDQLIPALKTLVIVTQGSSLPPSLDGKTGVLIEPEVITGRAELQNYLQTRIDKPLSMNDVNAICDRIVSEYRRAGRPVMDAVVPEQDITDGLLKIEIVEGRLGRVLVEGMRDPAASKHVASEVRIQPGRPIESAVLLEDVDWLNRRSPFQRYQVFFEKGANIGETDVVLHAATQRYPLRVYSSFENTGSNSTGNDRLVAGFNWGDAFGLGLDHQLAYQASSDDEIRRFQSHGLSYTVPLPWRHLATVSGTWSRSTPDFEDARFDSSGESWQLSGRYEIPLRSGDAFEGRLDQSLTFGVDFKRTNNDLEFGGQQVFARAAETVQFLAQYRFELPSSDGSTSGRVQLVVSPGYLTSANTESAYDAARAGSEPTYAYLSAALDRQWKLDHGFTFYFRSQAQVSSGPLLSAEQLGIGGSDSVRGYRERALNSDVGLLTSVELESPGVKPLGLLGLKDIPEDLRMFLFADAGVGWNFQADDSNPSSVGALSLGPGLRYRLSEYGTVDLSYGLRLADHGVDDGDDGRAHFRLSATFAW